MQHARAVQAQTTKPGEMKTHIAHYMMKPLNQSADGNYPSSILSTGNKV